MVCYEVPFVSQLDLCKVRHIIMSMGIYKYPYIHLYIYTFINVLVFINTHGHEL